MAVAVFFRDRIIALTRYPEHDKDSDGFSFMNLTDMIGGSNNNDAYNFPFHERKKRKLNHIRN